MDGQDAAARRLNRGSVKLNARIKPLSVFPRDPTSPALYRSSDGKKMIVALTGVILMLFVIGHLLGNLQVFLGPRWVNDYAQHLRDLGPLLWAVRITLLNCGFPPHLFYCQPRA